MKITMMDFINPHETTYDPLRIRWDGFLYNKLQLIAKRLNGKDKADALLIITSPEGEGKTNMSVCISKQVGDMTGRILSNGNVFFNARDMIEFGQKTEKQLIIYDEPALDSLSSEWQKKSQQDLIKFLIMARKKQHFVIFNITKITKFNEYIIDRAIGMIKVYKDEKSGSRGFIYYKKSNLMNLYNRWKSSRKLLYNKYKNFRGSCPPYLLPYIINEEQYEKDKDNAIMSIGAETEKKKTERIALVKLKWGIWNYLRDHNLKCTDLEPYLEFAHNTISNWQNLGEQYGLKAGPQPRRQKSVTTIINNPEDCENFYNAEIKKEAKVAL